MRLVSFIFYLVLFFAHSAQASGQIQSCSTSGCHDQLLKTPFLHRPLRANDCSVCHRPGETISKSATAHPKLKVISRDDVNALCIVCHDDKSSGGHKVVHKAIAEKSCVECHNPHGSQNRHLLKRNPVSELCLSCHIEIKTKIHEAHGAVLSQDRGCLNCHEGHFSQEKHLLKAPEGRVCLNCHGKIQTKRNGQSIANIGQLLKDNPFKHKPVAEGQCDLCHDPHGSSAAAFLKTPYQAPGFALCLSCHKSLLIKNAVGDSSTQFRNGLENLHDFHLQSRIKAQCFSCHDAHAAGQPHLIRTEMKFDEWQVPIQFKATKSGGTCMAACHNEKTYDRVKPFSNEPGR